MSEAHNQLRSLVERIERVEAEIKEMNSDKSDIYKEARGNGFDVKTIRKVVAARKQDTAEREEAEALLDAYLAALGMLPDQPSRVHVHEATANPGLVATVNTGLVATVAAGMQTETGRKALVTALDIMIDREEESEKHLTAPSQRNDDAAGQSGDVDAVDPVVQIQAHPEVSPVSAPIAGLDTKLAPMKPGCLKPDACKTHFTSALCSGCANERAKARVAA